MTESDPQLETSKSQRKRDATALQELGQRLTNYTDQQLSNINLPESLLAAIEEFHRLPKSHGARKRQLQFIGRVMRDCDPQSIEDSLKLLENNNHTPSINSLTDSWLEKIQLTGFKAIEEFMLEYPEADRQLLRQLHRNLEKLPAEKRPTQLNKLRKYMNSFTSGH